MLITAAFALLAVTQTPLEEFRQLELELEKARMVIPATFDPESEERTFHKVAEIGKLEVVSVRNERVATAPLELWRIEVSGRGDVLDAAFLLHAVSRRESRLYELESLRADGKGYAARFLLPVWPADTGVSSFQEKLAQSRTLLEAVRRVRANNRLGDAAALLDAFPREASLRLTGADLGAALRLEGVSIGAASRATLVGKLKEAGFSVSRVQLPPTGACRPFALTAVYGTRPTEIVDDPAMQSPLCRVEAVPNAGRIAARGTNGPLTLRLRDIEYVDLFQVLNELTGESFVVDPAVKGRVDVELENATFDEAFAAMNGLVIGPGPLHIVSLTKKPEQTQTYEGEPISMMVTGAHLPGILCLFEEVTGLKMMAGPGAGARVTAYAHDVPWDRLMETMLATAGLEYTIDGTTVFTGSREGAVRACEYPDDSTSGALTNIGLTVEQLGRTDVGVLGVVKHEGKWKAYLHGPRHRLWLVEPGQKLFDATVRSVGPEGVTFE